MDILKILESGQTKENTTQVVQYIAQNPEKMDVLMDLFINAEFRINQRAAWPIGVIGEKYPEIITPHLNTLLNNLERKNLNDAVIRNTLRTFQTCPIPEELEGPLYEKCFHYLMDMKQAIAIKVFSMTVLSRIAHKFPELKDELIAVIQDQYEFGSKGFQSRARRILKELNK